MGVAAARPHFISFHFIFISFKTYLKLVFTIVDSEILIHTNYLQGNILNTKERIISGIFCRCIYHQPSPKCGHGFT